MQEKWMTSESSSESMQEKWMIFESSSESSEPSLSFAAASRFSKVCMHVYKFMMRVCMYV